jgi:hypothetical protein
MSKTIKKITPCTIKNPWFSPRGCKHKTLDLPLLNLRDVSHYPPMDQRMDIERKNGHIGKKMKKKPELWWAPRSYERWNWTQRFQVRGLEPSLPIDASMKTRFKNIEMTLLSCPSFVVSDPSLHTNVLLQMKNMNTSSSPDNHPAIKNLFIVTRNLEEKK